MKINKIKPYCQILPVTIFTLTIIFLSVFESIKQSFGIFQAIGLTEFTTKYYEAILTSKEFLDSFIFSFKYSLISSIMAILLGTLIAFYIKKYQENFLLNILQIGVILPHMIIGVLIFQLIAQTGFISRILYFFNIIDSYKEFPLIVYDKYGIGIIISFIYKEFAFVAITIYSVLTRISNNYRDQAFVLGASKLQSFIFVTLPMIMPNIVYSFIIIFTYSFSAYELPILMGSSYPKSMATNAYNYYVSPELLDRPYAMVYNTLLMTIGILLFIVFAIYYNKIISKEATYE